MHWLSEFSLSKPFHLTSDQDFFLAPAKKKLKCIADLTSIFVLEKMRWNLCTFRLEGNVTRNRDVIMAGRQLPLKKTIREATGDIELNIEDRSDGKKK